MKNRNLILSVLLWVICSSVFAITLPSSSYLGSTMDVDYNAGVSTISVGTSTSITGSYLGASQSYDGVCNDNAPVSPERTACCASQVSLVFGMSLQDCAKNYNTDCLNYYSDCLNSASLPLGSPLLLLPFALVYAIYAVIRKRKEETL